MIQGILGKKLGMTQVFKEDGTFEPVTAIEAGPCAVVQVKDDAGDVKKLKAGPDISMDSLKNLKPGDAINLECDSKGVITSLVPE